MALHRDTAAAMGKPLRPARRRLPHGVQPELAAWNGQPPRNQRLPSPPNLFDPCYRAGECIALSIRCKHLRLGQASPPRPGSALHSGSIHCLHCTSCVCMRLACCPEAHELQASGFCPPPCMHACAGGMWHGMPPGGSPEAPRAVVGVVHHHLRLHHLAKALKVLLEHRCRHGTARRVAACVSCMCAWHRAPHPPMPVGVPDAPTGARMPRVEQRPGAALLQTPMVASAARSAWRCCACRCMRAAGMASTARTVIGVWCEAANEDLLAARLPLTVGHRELGINLRCNSQAAVNN